MELEQIQVSEQEVATELETIKQAIKDGYISKRTTLARDLLAVYGHLQHGGKIIDVFKAFHKAGLDEEGHPKLGIVSFDARWCYLYKRKSGGALFSKQNKESYQVTRNKSMGDVEVPPDTFNFPSEDLKKHGTRFKCVAPQVPPRILSIASTKLTPQYYHVIFEPELWSKSKVPIPPRDPILGKMLTPNIFGIIATWELTELERSIISGRL